MKQLFTFLLIALSLLSQSSFAQVAPNIWDPPFKQGIAAEVESQIITYEELRREIMPLIPRVRESSRNKAEFDQQMGTLYFEVMQNIIDSILIVKEFQEKEFQMPSSYVENEFDRILIEDFNNDRGKFHEYIAAQGKNVREFRRDLRERIIVSAMRGEKRKSQSQISPERIENFYNENKIHFYEDESVKLRIITLKAIADESPDLLRQNVEQVIKALDENNSFEAVAQKYSQDSKREKGGDWGWIKRGDLKEELSEVAFNLSIGSHSDPIQIGSQTMILYVEDYREEGIQPLPMVRDKIEEILVGQLARQAQEQWLERLRKQAYVKYY